MNPSFHNGFASPWYGGVPKYPNLWRGCVGYWSPLLGPTGATIFDVSGRASHGTLTNTTPSNAWTVQSVGSSIRLDADVGAYVSIPISATVTEATLFLRLRRIQHTPTETSKAGSWLVNTADFASLYAWIDGNIYDGTFRTTRQSIGAGAVADRSQWHTVAITTRPGTGGWQFWQNGNSIYSTTGDSSSTLLSTIAIGGQSPSFDGYISEFGLWIRELSASELILLTQRPGIMLEIYEDDLFAAQLAAASRLLARRRRMSA